MDQLGIDSGSVDQRVRFFGRTYHGLDDPTVEFTHIRTGLDVTLAGCLGHDRGSRPTDCP